MHVHHIYGRVKGGELVKLEIDELNKANDGLPRRLRFETPPVKALSSCSWSIGILYYLKTTLLHAHHPLPA